MKLKLTLILFLFAIPVFAENNLIIDGSGSVKAEENSQVPMPTQATLHQYANQLFSHSNDPIAGNPNGKVTLVEFFDYRCIHCINMSNTINQLIKSNPDLKVVFKEFPIFGDISVYASKAALAAHMQGKYLQFHNALMDIGRSLNETRILDIARSSGLDIKKLTDDMSNSFVVMEIQTNYQLAQTLLINGTPVFIVGPTNAAKNSKIHNIVGEVDKAELQNAINGA
jgi:protein-disulfide isomerase